MATEMAPALSPQLLKTKLMPPKEMWIPTYIVTWEGSPPKFEMYFCTHLNATRSLRCVNKWFEPERHRLTIIKAKIADLPVLDFLPGQESQGCVSERLGSGRRLQDINKHTRKTKRRRQRGASQYEYKNSPIIDANVDDRLVELKRTFYHLSAVVTAEIVCQTRW